MRFLISQLFLILFITTVFLPTMLVVSGVHSNSEIAFNNLIDVPETEEDTTEKESSEGSELTDFMEDFIANQIHLSLILSYSNINFFSINILVSSAFADILTPPPKV